MVGDGVTADDFKSFQAYVAAFLQYSSNYHSFGSKKFIPEMSNETFQKILTRNPLYTSTAEKGVVYKHIVDKLYPLVEKEVFDINKPYSQFGYPSEGGVTGYFSRNIDRNDLAEIKEFLNT